MECYNDKDIMQEVIKIESMVRDIYDAVVEKRINVFVLFATMFCDYICLLVLRILDGRQCVQYVIA